MQAAFTYKLAELYNACSQESGTLQVRSQRWSFDRNRSIWKPPRRNSWFVSTRKENKQYLIPLDVHWTHSKVVAYGLGEDALHNPENAMMFLNGMQISTGNVDGVDEDEFHAISGRTLSEIACIRRANRRLEDGQRQVEANSIS